MRALSRLLVLVLSLASAEVAVAQTSAPPPLGPLERFIEKIDRDHLLVQQILDRHVEPAGVFAQAVRASGGMTASEMVAFAYHRAEAHEAGSGRPLVNDFAREYALHNPGFRAELNLPATTPTPPRTYRISTAPGPTQSGALMPPEVARIIEVVEKHVDGKMRAVVGRCCGVSGERSAAAIREGRSPGDILRDGLSSGSPPAEFRQRLAIAMQTAQTFSPSFAHEAAVAPFRDLLLDLDRSASRTVDVGLVDPDFERRYGTAVARIEAQLGARLQTAFRNIGDPRQIDLLRPIADPLLRGPEPGGAPALPSDSTPTGSGGGGGGGTAPPRHATARDGAFDIATHGRPGTAAAETSRRFGNVVRRASGRGGVVFGAPFDVAPGTPKPLSGGWVDLSPLPGGAGRGVFQFALEDGRVVSSSAVESWMAGVALDIVFGNPSAGLAAIPEGAEIGLAGIADRFSSPAALGRSPAACAEFVVAPALLGTPLARAAIVTDAVLFGDFSEVVLPRVYRAASVFGEDRQRVENFLAEGFATYKFFDRRLVISTGDVKVVAENADAFGRSRIGWSRFADLSDTNPRSDPPEAIAKLVDTLRDGSSEVAMLDRFAELLVVLRWYRASGQSWPADQPRPIATRGVAETSVCLRLNRLRLGPGRLATAIAWIDQLEREGRSIWEDAGLTGRFSEIDGALAERRRLVRYDIEVLEMLFRAGYHNGSPQVVNASNPGSTTADMDLHLTRLAVRRMNSDLTSRVVVEARDVAGWRNYVRAQPGVDFPTEREANAALATARVAAARLSDGRFATMNQPGGIPLTPEEMAQLLPDDSYRTYRHYADLIADATQRGSNFWAWWHGVRQYWSVDLRPDPVKLSAARARAQGAVDAATNELSIAVRRSNDVIDRWASLQIAYSAEVTDLFRPIRQAVESYR